MKLKKVVTTVIAFALLAGGGLSNVTYAMEPQQRLLERINYQEITPLWDSIADISPYISVEGTTLYPEVYVKAKSSSGLISGTMYLEKYSFGSWTSVASWSFKGTSYVFLSKSYIGTSGVKYRTRVVVDVDGEKAVTTSGNCEV